jgi:hypothetical protein
MALDFEMASCLVRAAKRAEGGAGRADGDVATVGFCAALVCRGVWGGECIRALAGCIVVRWKCENCRLGGMLGDAGIPHGEETTPYLLIYTERGSACFERLRWRIRLGRRLGRRSPGRRD